MKQEYSDWFKAVSYMIKERVPMMESERTQFLQGLGAVYSRLEELENNLSSVKEKKVM